MLQVLMVDYVSLVDLRKVTPALFRLARRHRIRVCMNSMLHALCIGTKLAGGNSWPRSGLKTKTLARALVRGRMALTHLEFSRAYSSYI